MRRGFLAFVFLSVGLFYGWNQGVTEGKLGLYIETHPAFFHGDDVLYVLGSFHEIMNQDAKALSMYQRIADIFPESRWGDDAQFGVASSYERLRNRKKALEEYEKYQKKYPNGRFHVSVSNNISLLKGL
jgi:tetratricopeptide (TPR) repeat protein